MNETVFADLQKNNCWFTFGMFDGLPPIDPDKETEITITDCNDTLAQRHIFAMLFGGFGYRANLSRARALCEFKLMRHGNYEPQSHSLDDSRFLAWLNVYARYCVLYGTILAYQEDTVRAAKYLILGLKTRAIDLFLPYCDFIRYVLAKLKKRPAKLAEYSGVGFSADRPMGGIELNGGSLIAATAERVISSLEGNKGEIILSYVSRSRYGSVDRLGSTTSRSFRNCIDLYEVLMVDKNGDLKKLRLYVNGYFTRENERIIRLPSGFHIDPCSPIASVYRFIE